MRVLIVDDDVDLLDLMTYALRRDGYTVSVAVDGQQALQKWQAETPELILLDVNLPKLSGFEVCRRIRHEHESRTPIILVTGRDDEQDIVRGLQRGADDYVTKPFSFKQLHARMQAVLRRYQGDMFLRQVNEVHVGDLVLDLQSHAVTKGHRHIQLTPLEFRILFMLAMNAGRFVPYTRLVEFAWGWDGGGSNLLKTHISHLRRKLSLPSGDHYGIKTLPGVGYCLSRPPDDRGADAQAAVAHAGTPLEPRLA